MTQRWIEAFGDVIPTGMTLHMPVSCSNNGQWCLVIKPMERMVRVEPK